MDVDVNKSSQGHKKGKIALRKISLIFLTFANRKMRRSRIPLHKDSPWDLFQECTPKE